MNGGILLQAVLVCVLALKRAWKDFPVFTSYSLINLAQTAALYPQKQTTVEYAWTYWIFEAASTLLGLGVVYEVFSHIFANHKALHRLALLVFRTAILCLLIAGTLIFYIQPYSARGSLAGAVFNAEAVARFIELALIILLIVFSNVFGLHWQGREFGIILGLGIFVAAELALSTALAHSPRLTGGPLPFIRPITFCLSLAVWISYSVQAEKAAELHENTTAQLERWNQALTELLAQ